MINKAVIELIKGLARSLSFIFNHKTSVTIEWYKNLFYTHWIKNNFKNCDGQINRFIKLRGGKYVGIESNTTVDSGTRLEAWDSYGEQKFSPEIRIGSNTLIGNDCHISCVNRIDIGNHVAIASRCLIVDNVHGDFNIANFTFANGPDVPDVFLKNAFTRDLYSKGPIIIEDNVHIGENCTIMAGVTIGHNSVIAANTVVLRSIKPFSMVFGNPSKSISYSN
jgi:acetyltransferase-like isoleucine patch superfamily enzyme